MGPFDDPERADEPGQEGQPPPVAAQVVQEAAPVGLHGHELALVALHQLARRDEAAQLEMVDLDRLDVHRPRPAAAAVVVGRRHQRETAERRVRLQDGDGALEPPGPELERVVHTREVVAAHQLVRAVQAAVAAARAGALEVQRVDAPAQVLAQEVGGVLVPEVGGDHGELRVRRRGLADAAQSRPQLRQRVRDEGDDADAHAPTSRRTRSRTCSAAAATGGESSSPNVSTSAASMANTMTSSGMS